MKFKLSQNCGRCSHFTVNPEDEVALITHEMSKAMVVSLKKNMAPDGEVLNTLQRMSFEVMVEEYGNLPEVMGTRDCGASQQQCRSDWDCTMVRKFEKGYIAERFRRIVFGE